MRKRHCLIGTAMFLISSHVAMAGDLVYQPVNPSFGGNPLNSTHLLAVANAQKDATASDGKRDGNGSRSPFGPNGPTTKTSDADLFVRQLQGRLLSALAGQVTDAIFGQNASNSGTVKFGDTTVTYSRGLTEIRLTITNTTDGTVTDISVPVLQTSSASSLNASSNLMQSNNLSSLGNFSSLN